MKKISVAILISLISLNINLFAQTVCDTASLYGTRNNLGLYGGNTYDLSFSYKTNRLFAAVETPRSLFISDDLCNTWYPAFPIDSLEYECGERGWGGRAIKVLTNQKGWTLVHTDENEGNLSAAVISFENGDTGTWKTVIDHHTLDSVGPKYIGYTVSGIDLSEYFFYSTIGPYVIKADTLPLDPLTNILDIRNFISGLPTNVTITDIAASNSPSGYPYYIIVNTSNKLNYQYGSLYKFDGTSFFSINLPTDISNKIEYIYTHPAASSGDTLFISGIDTNNHIVYYRTFDGGTNWLKIFESADPENYLADLDYSPAWLGNFPLSNGALLMNGFGLSPDLGLSWDSIYDNIEQVTNVSVMLSDYYKAVGISQNNILKSDSTYFGKFEIQENKFLEAIVINKISRSVSKSIFYIATPSGLAYTSAYNDTLVEAFDKWNPPYGQFPVLGVSETDAVALSPFDSMHVIAAARNSIAITTTGDTGFQYIQDLNSANLNLKVMDIKFITNDIVLLVKGGGSKVSEGGDIWRSTDGGYNWTDVTPSSNFYSGNTIEVYTDSLDTVIYIGSGVADSLSGYLWKSTDKGLSWNIVNSGPSYISENPNINGLPINDIAINPDDKNVIYIASGYTGYNALVKSTDGGITYTYLHLDDDSLIKGTTLIPDPLSQIPTSIAINQKYPDSVYVSIGREIYVYDALLDTFNLLYRGLPGEITNDLAYGSILVGTTTGFYSIYYDIDADVVVDIKKSAYSKDSFIQAFPNPANNVLSITSSDQFITNIHIRTIYGASVTILPVFGQQKNIDITLNNLSGGIYIIEVECGKHKEFKKIIISKN